ncbi:CNNM domain-containing protein [Halorussus pelagicus]|uniref:CNNM domain-containing protein n=1 Tax=Halorussus pelagicus TaxID=2505977 RepID=UPI000FFC461D|nr:hemolysin family protein [Halorussus pelagicus]
MSLAQVGLRLVAGLLLILANGFFVAIEFALTRVRQYPEAEFDTPRLRRAWEMTDELEIYLTSCQVGITASSIAVGIVAEPALAAIFEPVFANTALAGIGTGAALAFIIINLVHLTHGEQTPTYLGVERTKMVCRYGATPLYWFARVIRPIMEIGDTVAKWTLALFGIKMTGAWLETEEEAIETRAQLHSRLDSVLDRGELSEERHDEVLNALAAGDQTVGSEMVDSDDIVALSTEDPMEKNLDRMSSSPHTRYPLFGSDADDFRGIVYVPAVLDRIDALRDGNLGLEDVAAPPMTLSAATSVSDAIDQFQAESQELALVLSEGEVVGLLTATDALEAVMGEIEDPLDARSSRPGAVSS